MTVAHAMDPVVYLSQARFHQSIPWGTKGRRVSFAFLGAWPDELNRIALKKEAVRTLIKGSLGQARATLYILPSGCSRYVGVLLDALIRKKGLRMIAIDRPGAGATPKCALEDRVKLATEQTLHVLRYLDLQHINLLTHSAGWLYALELIVQAPALFLSTEQEGGQSTPCRFAFMSPFVPTSLSGSLLSLLPEQLVLCTPYALSTLFSLERAMAWSAGFVPASWTIELDPDKARKREERDAVVREKNRAKNPSAHFHPPYRAHAHKGQGLEAWKCDKAFRSDAQWPRHPRTGKKLASGEKLLLEYMQTEDAMPAITQDLLLCLAKAKGMDGSRLAEWIEERMQQVCTILATERPDTSSNDGAWASILVVWSENDGLIPRKGQEHLSRMFKRASASVHGKFTYQEWMAADAGHDTILASGESLEEIFEYFS